MTEPSLFPAPALVRLDRVTVRFGIHAVFSDLTLRLEKREHLALLGPNGSGKSTFFRLLQGELRPASYQPSGTEFSPEADFGRIYWNFAGEEETSALSARQHVRLVSAAQHGSYVRQGWNITGEEIILSGLDNAAMLYGEVSSRHYDRVAELADAAHASHLLSMQAPSMSQGQLRLTLLLRALISEPVLLLLDEPFDGLDSAARTAVGHCIELAAQRGGTLLVSAHRKKDIPSFITKALVISRGAIRAEALPALQETACPAPERTLPEPTVQAHPPLSRTPGSPPRFTAHGGAFQAAPDSPFVRALREKKAPLFRLRHVDVFIDRCKALSDINWTVQPGEQWVVSGANGSGKSTLLRLLYGEEFAAWGGRLDWCGGMTPSLEDIRAGVGYVSDRLQHSYSYDDLTAKEVVISGLRGTIGIYHAPGNRERLTAESWLDRLGILAYADVPLRSLSSGTARKTLLARALAASPPVLLLDEPCSGLDASSRLLFYKALSGLVAQGIQLVYVSHHEGETAPLFTHELHLKKGRVVFAGLKKTSR